MNTNKVIQSTTPDADTLTLKCPKCGAIWRSKGYYNNTGGWVYEVKNCPSGCRTRFFLNPVEGVVITRKKFD